MLPEEKFNEMSFAERLDSFSKHIMLNGLQRPWWVYVWHFLVWASNYLGFVVLACLIPCPADLSRGAYGRLLFVKFMVWQHLAEAIGVRQGPLSGHFGLPNNWRFRLSVGTLKYATLPCLGKKRHALDFVVHCLFFVACFGFLACPRYAFPLIRLLCACDAYIFLSDMTQFYASTGHGYWTMVLSACFPVDQGQLAGIQLALIFQWFFSGIGKVGPWFTYVNGPFMLQSKIFAGQRWLFNLLVKSEEDLSPTLFGICLAHLAAAVEYVAPMALLAPQGAVIWAGLVGIIGMHVYILVMPAPFDVYSWNTSYACCGVYLFYLSGSFGFDWRSASEMSPWLAAPLFGEFLLCWYGQFFPEHVGYYLSHRYWAGNWVQTIFFVRRTEAVKLKLEKVRTFSGHPVHPAADNDPEMRLRRYMGKLGLYSAWAYLWLGNFNMKCFVRMVEDAVAAAGAASVDEFENMALTTYCCGEFRDPLYTDPLLPEIQKEIGFDEGECMMVRLGSFGMSRQSSPWRIYDMKRGVVASGELTRAGLQKMHSRPSQSLDRSLPLAPGGDGKSRALLSQG